MFSGYIYEIVWGIVMTERHKARRKSKSGDDKNRIIFKALMDAVFWVAFVFAVSAIARMCIGWI